MEIMAKEKKTLSALVTEVKKYYQSGEINSTISRTPGEIYAELEQEFSNLTITNQDGLSIEAEDWWCNVRPSANDPVMRLNLEANTKYLMEEKRDAILKIIRQD